MLNNTNTANKDRNWTTNRLINLSQAFGQGYYLRSKIQKTFLTEERSSIQ